MTRSIAILGGALVALGGVLFVVKVVLLDMPILPSRAENSWRVELQVDARATGQRGSISARLPRSDARQEVYDEQVTDDGLSFEVRDVDGQRVGVWRGDVRGVRRLSHGFRVQLVASPSASTGQIAGPRASDHADFLEEEAGLPVGAPELYQVLDRLQAYDNVDAPARMRQLFGFVADEIETVPSASRDALLTLAAREGSAAGKANLLVSLLRTSRIPARVAAGLRLAQPRTEREVVFVEALIDGQWVPLFPSSSEMGRRPRDLLVLRTGGASLVEAVGIDAIEYRYRVVREELRPSELMALMLPPSRILTSISLYRLPVATQEALRVLLVIPLAALLIAFFRNVIGLQTFGTFLPILVALSLRGAGLATGFAMIAGVLIVGIGGRLLLDRFHLLFVPRLCVLLCVVILLIVSFTLMGYSFQSRDALMGVLFPIVVLTMLIERFSIQLAEEGARSAVEKLLTTTLVILGAYPLFEIHAVSHLMFGFPELTLCVMGLLVLIGGYTGYRAMEIFRFRALAALSRGVDA